MACGLDELIEFLLEEIALGGQTGLTVLELANRVQQFYQQHYHAHSNLNNAAFNQQSPEPLGKGALDRSFLSKIWSWLARHPDVSIGRNNEHKHKSLDEVEELFPGYTVFEDCNHRNQGAIPLSPKDPQMQKSMDTSNPDEAFTQNNGEPRLYVNEARMSIAICGHPPDSTRVHPSEWVLLSCIAAARQEGILQGELVRISAQDKRSVPKRTDALHQKGYITKKTIYLRGNKTSRLYLRRYVESAQSGQNPGGETTQLTVRHIVRKLFDVLRNSPLIAYEDVGDALGMTGIGRARILSQLVRYFSSSGCLKRVKTTFRRSARPTDLKICIQYLKEPNDTDMEQQTIDGIQLDQPVVRLASLYENELRDGDIADLEEIEDMLQNNVVDDDDDDAAEETFTGGPQPLSAQWNPERILANVLFEVAREAGFDGMTNAVARNIITGPFIKRTLESLLVKLSHRTLQTQPSHLRHLSILRAQEHTNGVAHYLHYTFNTFVEMVSNGQAKWSDVFGGDQFQKDNANAGVERTAILNSVNRDGFGFVRATKPTSQAQDGRTTMLQLLQDARVKNIQPRAGEPSLRKNELGHLEIYIQTRKEPALFKTKLGRPRGRPRRDPTTLPVVTATQEDVPIIPEGEITRTKRAAKTRKDSKASHLKPKRVDEHGQVIIGRPRKFVRGTERYWRDIFSSIIEERDPGHFRRHGRTGIMNDPGALQVFYSRPQDFDHTLVRALERELPVPSEPQDISQDWIDNIQTLMDRAESGVYISPPGYRPGSHRKKALFFILRHPLLCKLDWADRHECWPWQFLSSSASHSLHYRRFYPRLGATPRNIVASLRSQKKTPSPQSGSASRTTDPTRGICENVQSAQEQVEPHVSPLLQPTSEPQPSLDTRESTDTTENGRELRDQSHNLQPAIQPDISNANLLDRHASTSEKDAGVLQVPIAPTSPPKTAASTRSMRKRKPTQKAAENLDAKRIESQEIEQVPSHFSQPVHTSKSIAIDLPGNLSPKPSQFEQSGETALTLFQPSIAQDFPTKIDEVSNEAPNIPPPSEAVDMTLDLRSLELCPAGAAIFPTENKEVDGFVAPLRDHTNVESAIGIANVDTNFTREASSLFEQRTYANPESTSTISNAANFRGLVEPNDTTLSSLLPVDSSYAGFIHESMQAENSESGKRKWAATDAQSFSPDTEEVQSLPTPKKTKIGATKSSNTTEITRAQVSKLCRIMVLELVGLCSGLTPNVPWTLRRAMVPRWQEAEVKADQLSAKNVRAAIKALCESGKLKQITFAARGKAGTMLTMSIIALRSMDATNPAVLNLQKKILEAEPADYVPPELEVESHRLPNELNKQRYSEEITRSKSDDIVETPSAKQKTLQGRQKRVKEIFHAYSPEGIDGDKDKSSGTDITTSASLARPIESIPSLNTGFLTLKCSRLKELDIPSGNQYKYKPPATPLRFVTVSAPENPANLGAKPRVARRNGLRYKRDARFDPETHRLIWKKPGATKLPTCLDEVPNIKLCRDEANILATNDIITARFEAEIDCVATWEQKHLEAINHRKSLRSAFINHTFTQVREPVPVYATIIFKALVRYDEETGSEAEEAFPAPESWPPFIAALKPENNVPALLNLDTTGRLTRKNRKRKVSAQNALSGGDDDLSIPPSKKLKRNSTKAKPRRALRTDLDKDIDNAKAYTPGRRNRLTQLLRTITEEEKYRIAVAVVIVRTLTGGLEKFIDWQLVRRLIPAQEEQLLRDAWKSMANRYRGDIADLTESLQHRYLDALTNGWVPSINFDGVHDTDWEGIFEWGLKSLDKTIIKKTEDLPATRGQMLKCNDYIFSEFKGIRDMLGYNFPLTMPRKEEAMSGTVFGKALQDSTPDFETLGVRTPAMMEESNTELIRAKSWIMATLLTPANLFDTQRIQAKLLQVAPTLKEVESLLEKAIMSLQRDKLVSRSQPLMGTGRGAIRNQTDRLQQYEPSAKFFEQFDFRRLITATMLRRAATYKLEILDAAFDKDDEPAITITKDTILDDGEMVAILNLFAVGMLRIRPGNDIPASRWGLDWQKHGYTTRLVDRKALNFSVIISPIKSNYVFGDPLADRRYSDSAKIPRGEIDRVDNLGHIPLWFDILHTFQTGLWEMVLAAILGLVSTRPGIDAELLARTLWFGVSIGEVNMVLEWARRLDLVKRTQGGGWESCEWWWLGLGSGGGWLVG